MAPNWTMAFGHKPDVEECPLPGAWIWGQAYSGTQTQTGFGQKIKHGLRHGHSKKQSRRDISKAMWWWTLYVSNIKIWSWHEVSQARRQRILSINKIRRQVCGLTLVARGQL